MHFKSPGWLQKFGGLYENKSLSAPNCRLLNLKKAHFENESLKVSLGFRTRFLRLSGYFYLGREGAVPINFVQKFRYIDTNDQTKPKPKPKKVIQKPRNAV